MHTEKSKLDKVDACNAAIIALIVTFTYIWFSKFHFDIHHDGLILASIDALLSGKRLLLDEFQFYGVGSSYFNFFLAKIVGFNLVHIRYAYAFIYGYIYFLTYVIARSGGISKDNSSVLLLILFTYTHFFLNVPVYYMSAWPSVICLAMVMSVVAIEIYFHSVYKTIVIATFFIAIFITKINYGALFLLAHFISVIVLRRTSFFYELSVFSILISIIFLLAFVFGVPMDEYINQAVLAPLQFTSHNQFTTESTGLVQSIASALFLRSGHGGVDYIVHFLPIVNILACIFYLRDYTANSKIIAIYGFFSWFLFFPIPALLHIYLSLPLIIVSSSIGLISINRSLQMRIPLAKHLLPTIILIFIIYRMPYLTSVRLFDKLTEYRREFPAHQGIDVLEGMRMDKGTTMNLNKIKDFLATSEKTTFLNLSNSGFYNIIAKNEGKNTYSLAPYNYLWEWGNIGQAEYYTRLRLLLENKSRDNLVLSAVPFPLHGYRIVEVINPAGSAGWEYTQDFAQELYINVAAPFPTHEIAIAAKILDSLYIPDTSWNPCLGKNCLLKLSLPDFLRIDQVYVALQDPEKRLFSGFSKNETAILDMECPNLRRKEVEYINITGADYDEFSHCLSAAILLTKGKIYYSNLSRSEPLLSRSLPATGPMRILGMPDNTNTNASVFATTEKLQGPVPISPNTLHKELYILVPNEFNTYSGAVKIISGEKTYFGTFKVQ